MSWDLDEGEAREWAENYLAALEPPRNDEWVVSRLEAHDWGWVVIWTTRRRNEGSTDIADIVAGNGPLLIDKVKGRVAVCGTALPIEHYISEWRAGRYPDQGQPPVIT